MNLSIRNGRRPMMFLFATGFLALSGLLMAQSGGDFVITKSTIDNGGGVSTGGNFSLTGTIGQHDANRQISSGSGFLLAGGFWANPTDSLFKDSFEDD